MKIVSPEESAAIAAVTELLGKINQIKPKHIRMAFLAFVANRLKRYVEADYELDVMIENMAKEVEGIKDHGTSH